ncbi:hypothetical protein HXX76_005762 [Chlamydomonas incerta]|uniref:PUA domain-containing protein n=1 Tax=Chlamydomonas incerta TaxID=51695 RepID=A0A835TD41_CHLIN|nr:hypothetical protein HXX76_005762 [Chlamydomonas incerta]|eukprot:KAG2438154.1 hypothetical protein HXX76_005762 [Chlamydomonas incerta]
MIAGPRPRGYVKETLGTDASIFVVKVGTTSLMRPEHQTVNLSSLAKLCEAVRDLRSQGHHVVIVTSGAVGVGAQHLSLPGPEPLRKRALAAVGQVQLIKYYEDFLGALGLKCAQLLLTLDNLANRSQYLNARTTFIELLAYGVVPIVNENDTVAVQELRFGDNDTLSAQVAALVQADWLFLLTDVDCLYTANPKDDPNATPIYEVEDISRLTADTSTRGTQWGTGGMATKLTAGRIATAAGCTMVICNSTAPENIVRIAQGEPKLGTKFFPLPHSLKGRKRWVLSVPVRGQLWLDAGAVRAVRDKHRPLVAAGIMRVEGDFGLQECVSLMDPSGCEFARGLCGVGSQELCALLAGTGAGGGGSDDGGGAAAGGGCGGSSGGYFTSSGGTGGSGLLLLRGSSGGGDGARTSLLPPLPPAGTALGGSTGGLVVAGPETCGTACGDASAASTFAPAAAASAAATAACSAFSRRASSNGGGSGVGPRLQVSVAAAATALLPARYDSAASFAAAAGGGVGGGGGGGCGGGGTEEDVSLCCDLSLEVVIHRGNLVLLSASEELPPPPPLQQQATADIDDLLAVACNAGTAACDDEDSILLPALPVSPLAASAASAAAAVVAAATAAAMAQRHTATTAVAASGGGGAGVQTATAALLPPPPPPPLPADPAVVGPHDDVGKLAPCYVVLPLLPDVEEGGGGLLERAATSDAASPPEFAKLGEAVTTAAVEGAGGGGAATEGLLTLQAYLPTPLPPVPLPKLPA